MSTPIKKKPTAKAAEPKAKYAIGSKVWYILNHKGKPEEIWELKLATVNSRKIGLSNNVGVRTGYATEFSYQALTPIGGLDLFYETELFPTFQSAANKFAEAFTHLLK